MEDIKKYIQSKLNNIEAELYRFNKQSYKKETKAI